MRRQACLAIAVSILWVLVAMPAGTALAAPAAAPVDPVVVPLMAGTTANFATEPKGSVGFRCQVSAVAALIGTEPVGGSFVGKIPSWTLGRCLSTVPNVTVRSATFLGLPYAVSVDPNLNVRITGANGQPVQVSFVLATPLGQVTAGYGAGAVGGLVTGANHSFVFDPQELVEFQGSGLEPKSLFFDATYGPAVQPQGGGLQIG